MKYIFPYNYLEPLEIPEKNLIGIFEAGQDKPDASPEKIVTKALQNPIGVPRLSELAEQTNRVLILCDDQTRYTPAYQVIPHILDELHSGGLTDDRIRILIASGTHRLMTYKELVVKLGASIIETFEVEQHLHDVRDELFPLDVSHKNAEFLVNRRLKEADLIIGVGNIVPHCIKGFSGGSNIILPGVSGSDAIGAMHWLNLDQFGEDILGIRDNKVRRLIDEVAEKAGLNYIVNTIVNNDMEIIHCVAGNPYEAHRKGAELASRVFNVNIPCRADIVLFDAYKNDLDFWQTSKGIIPAYVCMKQDAVVIDVADCPEGICHNIPDVGKYGFKDLDIIMDLHNRKVFHPVVTHFLVSIYRVVTERGRCIMVSNGISRESAEHTGLLYAKTPQEALDHALEIKGKDASIIVLRHAGNICPVIGDKAL
ncbi:MAG: nickel-dependent lactate racemase [Candidatus Latescibacteria bacterium]|nr:nickel-dependent lactate racemase [Candidatus Latescibacterota bacterium]